jgi:pimeloyl-ACP methyl ester carboxylesterase
MTIEQFILDTHELVELLLQRFGRSKLILVAHSWGSIVGALAVQKYPELFAAYVAISQAVDPPESERMMYRFALETAVKLGNSKASAQLRRLGEPPYESFSDYRTMKNWVHRFRDAGYSEISPWKFARVSRWLLQLIHGAIYCGLFWACAFPFPTCGRKHFTGPICSNRRRNWMCRSIFSSAATTVPSLHLPR